MNKSGSSDDTTASPRKNPPFTPASLDKLSKQISQLYEYPTGYVPPTQAAGKRKGSDRRSAPRNSNERRKVWPGGRSPDCFLTWASGAVENDCAITLGPYARWLVAARLIMVGRDTALLSEELSTDTTDTNRLFAIQGDPNKWFKLAYRYLAPAAADELGRVLEALLSRLDQKYAKARGRGIELEDFMSERVPIAAGSLKIGREPFDWFEQWLRLGAGLPSQRSREALPSDPGARQTVCECPALKEALRLLADPQKHLGYQRIINVSADDLTVPLSDFAATVASSTSMPVVYIRLSSDASRKSVLKQLYEAFYLPSDALDVLNQRPIDLSVDLAPIRRAITVNRVLLIFDAWENAGGTFEALHEYLCNTHWGEFLRVLAQPDLPAWRASPTDDEPLSLKYALLVLTTRRATELSPWVRFVDDGAPEEHRPESPSGDTSGSTVIQMPSADLLNIRPESADEAGISGLEHAVREGTEDAGAAWNSLVAIVSRRLVAASVNGIRRGTLRRCLDHWHRLFWVREDEDNSRTPGTQFDKQIGELLEQPGLDEIDDEEVESLSGERRSLELDSKPSEHDEPSKVITFASLALRAEFVRNWTKQEAEDSPRGESLKPANTCSWAHVNFLLGEECLRQATSQLRHLQAEGVSNPYEVRRVVQAIYHGLMSLTLQKDNFAPKAARRGELYGPMLPADERRRYKYLYSYLYCHIVEEDTWKMARSFGRSDICVDLLTLFVAPHLGGRMLTEAAQAPGPDPLKDIDLGQIARPVRHDSAMWSDLLEALCRSGIDLGGLRGNCAVKWALRMLPGGEDTAQTNGLLPSRSDGAYYRTAASALKLRVDWTQSDGQITNSAVDGQAVDGAWNLCTQELKRLGIDASLLERLRTDVREAFGSVLPTSDLPHKTGSSPSVANMLQAAFKSTLVALEEKIRMSADSREAASAVLFRIAHILATRAEDAASSNSMTGHRGNDESESDARIRKKRSEAADYANVCAVCWVADNLRFEAGTPHDMGMRWPLADAHVMRFYVRICLKVARLMAEAHPGEESPRLAGLISRVLEHGQSLVGVYTRQHFHSRRERVSMVLLEITRVRTWIRIELTRKAHAMTAKHKDYQGKPRPNRTLSDSDSNREKRYLPEPFDWHWGLLDASWTLLQEAEGHLFSLGYQKVQIRRLYLERIKTVEAMVRVMTAFPSKSTDSSKREEVMRHLQLAQDLLKVLKQAGTSNNFWKQSADREAKELGLASEAWKQALVSAK